MFQLIYDFKSLAQVLSEISKSQTIKPVNTASSLRMTLRLVGWWRMKMIELCCNRRSTILWHGQGICKWSSMKANVESCTLEEQTLSIVSQCVAMLRSLITLGVDLPNYSTRFLISVLISGWFYPYPTVKKSDLVKESDLRSKSD